MPTLTQATYGFDTEMSLFAPATNVVKSLTQLMNSAFSTPVAKTNTIDADEAFARMLQAQFDAEDAAMTRQEQEDADFAFALSLQFEEADMIGASASYAGLGALGQDYYYAFYAA